MINKLILHNFGPHKYLELDFLPGLNVIFGENDTGKTTGIMRSLDFLVNNSIPPGVNYLPRWCSEKDIIEVSAVIDSNKLTRIKSKSSNKYIINDDFDHPLKTSDTSTMEEINKITRFSDLNFQYQTDPPFLLLNTSGEIARYLNKTIDLEEIDKSFAYIEKEKRNNKKEIKDTELKIKKMDKELEDFNNLEELEENYNLLATLDNRIKENEKKVLALDKYFAKKEGILLEIKLLHEYIEKEEIIKKISKELQKVVEIKERYNQINRLILNKKLKERKIIYFNNILTQEDKLKKLLQLDEKINKKENELKKIADLSLKYTTVKSKLIKNETMIKQEELLKEILLLNQKLEENIPLAVKLEKLNERRSKVKKELEIAESDLNLAKQEYKKLMGNRCPLCKQEII